MSHRLSSVACFPLLVLGLSAPVARAADIDDLIQWIPTSANSLAIVRMKDLLQSPHGRKQKWTTEHKEAYASGLVSTPLGVDLAVRATEVRTAGADQAATYTLYRTSLNDMVRQIAHRDKVTIDRVNELVAVRSLRGPYFVQLAPMLMGSVLPSDRQVLSRWLKSSANQPPAAGDNFLIQAITNDEHDQIVIAVETSDMLDAESVAQWISSHPKTRETSNVSELSALFAGMRGIRLSVQVTDKIVSRLQLTFSRPVGSNAPGVEKCILMWLAEAGARIDQFDSPETTTKGNSVTLEVQIDDEGFRRIISLIQTPHADVSHANSNGSDRPADGIASRTYFQAVNKLVDNLSKQNRKATEYNQTALWHENFARKISSLSVAGVDPDLAAWGHSVSEHLLGLASSLRGTPVEVDKLDRKIRVQTQMNAYRYASTPYADLYRPGSVNVTSNLGDVRAAQNEAVLNGNDQRDQIWTMIYDDRTAIQKKMEDKYKIVFGKP
ncbi:MAG: hypothetical protein HY290_15135 [Planctomycetia bacterium]|nr:hypothetical protein [Planctomycetia bacterium]